MGKKKFIKKDTRKKLFDNGGFILLPITIWAWIVGLFGAPVIAAMSVVTMGFFLFRSTVPCGGETRIVNRETGEYELCRHNAKGLLRGCNQVVAHKWGNAKLMIHRTMWGRLWRSLWRDGAGKATAVSAVTNVGLMAIASGALLVSMLK